MKECEMSMANTARNLRESILSNCDFFMSRFILSALRPVTYFVLSDAKEKKFQPLQNKYMAITLIKLTPCSIL